RREVIEPLGLTVSEAAKVLGVGRQALSSLLNGKAALTSEMGLRVEKAFGPKMEHLMRMQLAFDLAQARKAERAGGAAAPEGWRHRHAAKNRDSSLRSRMTRAVARLLSHPVRGEGSRASARIASAPTSGYAKPSCQGGATGTRQRKRSGGPSATLGMTER